MNNRTRTSHKWAIGIILIGVALMLTPGMVLGGALDGEAPSYTQTVSNRELTDIDFALEETASISGTLYEADGTTPVQVEAWVSAWTTAGEWLYAGSVNQDNGTYTIQVPAGTYLVDAGGIDRAVQFYDNAGTNYENATPITLLTGQNVTGIDFALQPGGMISGTVTSGGQPLENVNVGLHDSNIGNCTNAQGEYTLYNVPLDVEFTLYVGGDKWNWCENGPTNYVSETTSITLSIANQYPTGVNFSLEQAAIISGTVYEANGTTTIMTDSWVTAMDANTLEFVDFTEVNGDGTYEMAVNPGKYRVYATAVDNALQYYDQQGIDPNDANVVTAISGQVTGGIDFALPLGGIVTGIITDDQGTPLANISTGISDSYIGACTNAQGEYTLYDLPLYTELTVYVNGGEGNWCENGPTNYTSKTTSITLSMGNRYPTGVNFTLEQPGIISGMVTAAEDSSPLNNIWVCAFDYNATAFNFTDPWHCAETQADGSYTISEIPPGNKRVWLFPEDRLRPFYDNSPSFNGAIPVMVTDGQLTSGIDFSLPLAGIISGTIYNLDGTTPLGGVTISTANGDYMECSQADGSYRIFVPAGSHVVKASTGVCDSEVDFTTQYYDSEWNTDGATAITISTGQTVSDIDFTKRYSEPISRIFPADGQSVNAANYESPNFTFAQAAGVEWYQVWIGSGAASNYNTTLLFQWFPATDVSAGASAGSGICEAGVCTIPRAVWPSNGANAWWMTTWQPGETIPDVNRKWQESTFNFAFAAQSSTMFFISPADKAITNSEPNQITWEHDINTLWYHLWVGNDDYNNIIYFDWLDATEHCNATICTLDVSGYSFPNDGYEIWTEKWGPDGLVGWLQVNSGEPSTFNVQVGTARLPR